MKVQQLKHCKDFLKKYLQSRTRMTELFKKVPARSETYSHLKEMGVPNGTPTYLRILISD